jgi:glycosyltransferase involved in cell wall biosynthesis
VLFVSLGIPGLGGSSSAAYDLFRRMREEGAPVDFLNLVEEERAAFLEYSYGPSAGNPSGLPGVHTCWLDRGLDAPPGLEAQIARLDPVVIVGVGWIAARIALRAASGRQVVLLTGSCRSAQDLVTSGKFKDVVALLDRVEQTPTPALPIHQGEREVYRDCRMVLTHSTQTLRLVERFFPPFTGKIFPEPFWFAEWICDGARLGIPHARRFEDRDIDLLFVATSWSRPEKNYPMVQELAARFPAASIHLVGDAIEVPPAVVHHGLVTERSALFELMGRSRVVVCPSLMDAAPGVLFEGAVLGCNVVASRNCGNWELCHPELLADPFHPDRFAECIERARGRKYPDQLDRFLRPSSYQRLLRALAALTQPFKPEPLITAEG